jgi:hypothetical protein
VQLDERCFTVLHELRLRGLVEVTDAETAHRLVTAGFAARTRIYLRLTPEGRDVHASWARVQPDTEHEATVRRSYERFLPLNKEFLRVCSDWQLRPGGITNDHSDPRYDWGVVDRLRALDERIAPVVARVARTLDRFAVYRPRLREALRRVDEGEIDWFTSPRIDSYHTVWMQLHEDLLLALGADRSAEPHLG